MKVNLDAQWLERFAETLGNSLEAARLRTIAEHLEALDSASAFDRGYKAAMDSYYGRSNVVTEARKVSPKSGAIIAAALANGQPVKRAEAKPKKPDLLDELGIEIEL